jgi:hypothetical protein
LAIDYISNEQIDFKKWDRCIKKAFNGNIYAYSWYLNIVTQRWNALIENDYERVMPLPKTFFAGNEIILHPKLAGQLGIFSTTTLNEYHISSFFNSIPSNYRYVSLKLNKHNQLQNTFRITDKKVNLDMDLIKPYKKLREIYPEILNELVAYSFKMNYRVVTKIPVDSIAKFEQHVSPVYSYLHPEDLISMQLIVAAAINNKMGQLCGLYNENNQLLALTFFVWSHQKATMAFCLFSKKNLQLPALFFLIDDFIRNNSEKNLILHIELNANSKLVSLLEKIGAKKSESLYYYRNQLPCYLKPFVA